MSDYREPRRPSKRQIVFNWMQGDDLTKLDGWWGTSDQVALVDELIKALAAADQELIAPMSGWRNVQRWSSGHRDMQTGSCVYWEGVDDQGQWVKHNDYLAAVEEIERLQNSLHSLQHASMNLSAVHSKDDEQ